jgi:long-chain acyl-CoA synthetase
MAHETIPKRLADQGRQRPNAPAYFVKRGGSYQPTDWATYAREVQDAARALITLGMEPGGTVCILGFNRPEWSIIDMAAMAAGGVPAGIYTTCSAEEVAYILGHAACGVALLEDAGQLAKVVLHWDALPALRHVVMMKGATVPAGDDRVLSWEAFMAKAAETDAAVVVERTAALAPEGLATLIYTSGTTGPPKGVMLSHHNLAWTAQLAGQIADITPNDCSVSYLPLSHIAEQIFTLHGPATYGYAVYYAESLERVAENFKEARPTILFAVPRIWEKMAAGIKARLKDLSPIKRALFRWATDVGRRVIDHGNRGLPLSGALALQARIADRLIHHKVKAAIGLDRVSFAVTGAAPISSEVLEFLSGLNIAVREVYGQSEDTGPTSFNRPGRTRFGSVGPVIPGVEVRIDADGEICVRGPNVFLGYYKDQGATDEALEDGWLRSGDLGRIDDEGFLHITGRKKEILITAGGKNIAPKNIEASLKDDELIAEAVIIGDRRKYLTALIAVDPDVLARFCNEHGIDLASAHSDKQVLAALQRAVDATNARFARVEHIRKFAVLPGLLTVEDGELTPTLKVKRRIVYARHDALIEGMYPPEAEGAGTQF